MVDVAKATLGMGIAYFLNDEKTREQEAKPIFLS